jgi:hydrogenase maturation protease
MRETILIGGVGNVLFGDDGFGPAVVASLASLEVDPCVRIEDFGTRSFDLAFALGDARAAILIDTVARGGEPGQLYVLDLATLPMDEAKIPC